jgi:hypothetical protein
LLHVSALRRVNICDKVNVELILQLSVSKCSQYFLANQVNEWLLSNNLNEKVKKFAVLIEKKSTIFVTRIRAAP